MAVVTKAVLKTYFEDGKEPDENKYIDLIDSMAVDSGQYLLVDGSRNVEGDLRIEDDLVVDDDLTVKGGLSTGIAPPFTIPDGTLFLHDNTSADYGFQSAEGPMFISSNTFYDGTDWRTIKIGLSSTFYIDNVSGLRFRTDLTSRAAGAVATHVNKMQLDLNGNMKLAGGVVIGNSGGTVDDDCVVFYQGSTRIGEVGGDNTAWLKLNHVTNKPIYTPRYMRVDGGLSVTASVTDAGDGVLAATRLNIYSGATLVGDIKATGTTWLRINESTAKKIWIPNDLYIGGHLTVGSSSIQPADGGILYTGSLISYKNSTQYSVSGYHPVTAMIHGANYWGHTKSGGGGEYRTVSSEWSGIPANTKAIVVRMHTRDSALHPQTGLYFQMGPANAADQNDHYTLHPMGSDVWASGLGIVTVTSNTVYIKWVASGTNTMDVFLGVVGYYI
jgi:hypothetical protein